MRAYIKAELLKNRHSEWARLMVIFPTISILCSVYFSFGNAAYYQMNQYNWWYMCFLPIQVIAGSIFICRREKRLKYRAVQMLPVSAGKIWIAKVVSCIGQIIVSTGMIAAAVAGISLVLKQLFTGGNLFSPITVAAAWGLLVCAICWQIPLWMFCYQKTGMVLTFLLGMGANSILSTVWTTGSRWWMNPFAILPRLMCPVLQILPNGLPAVPESVMFTPQALEKSVIVPGTSSRFGYYDSYIKDQNGIRDTVQYSYYAGQVFSPPSGGKQGLISFNISNNLEMKFKDKNDSIRKVSLIDDLSMGISYNTAAQVRPWSDLSFNLRLKLSKSYTLSMSSTFATYAYEFDENGRVVPGNRTEWSYGRFGRWSGYGTSLQRVRRNMR